MTEKSGSQLNLQIYYVIRAWWHYSDNFGDALTPYIIKKLCGVDVQYVDPGLDDQDLHMVTGSILGTSGAANCIIWGNGISTKNEQVFKARRWAAVRGPISAKRVVDCGFTSPEGIGDPAIILPRLYNPTVDKQYELGFTPNVIDYQDVSSWFTNPIMKVINLAAPIETVIDQIVSCNKIISSSLHGLITAAAYGIPTIWVKHSDNIIGDGTKYRDFLLSIGMDYDSVYVTRNAGFETMVEMPFRHTISDKLVDDLLAVCPLPRNSNIIQ